MTSSSTLPTPTSHPVLFEPTSVNHSSLEALVASLAPSNSVSPSAPSVPTAPPDPDIVVIELRTSLTIFNYHAFYDTPIHDFRPTFVALPDGSLLAPPMNEDLQLARASLLMIGAYLLLASRNIIVSFGYIHRVKVKRKEIFYILFASQAIAPTPWISLLYAFFNTAVNCTTVNRLVISSTALSTWLLLTGIFGIKAYRCLSQSRIVLVTLVLLQLGSVAVVSIDLVRMTGSYRTPAGNCSAVPGSSDFLSVIMILIFVEAFFICCCFIRAVWTSSRFLAAQGRLTYRISLDGDKDEQVQVVPRPTPAANRGWWDYTPRASAAPPDGEISHLPHEQEVDHRKSLVVGDHRRSTVFSTITTFWATSPTVPRAPLTGRTPIPHAAQGRRLRRAVPFFGSQVKEEGRQVISPLPAAPPNGLLKGLKPRMLLFREVMRDELCYTTLVTAICVISAIFAVVGMSHEILLKAPGWFGLNWAIISVLAIHSSGRVVQRHEQEALLRDPLLWDPRLRPDNDDFPGDRRQHARNARQRQSFSSYASDLSFLPRAGRRSWEVQETPISPQTSEKGSVYSAS